MTSATKKIASLLTALLWSNWILAIQTADVGYREVQNLGLEPWVTIIASGVRSTVTPIFTFISDMPTTINVFPSPTTATTSTASKPTSAATDAGAFEICHNVDGQYAPICPMPNNNTLYVSEIYYITWDTSYYTASNTTVRVVASYYNATSGGPQAFESAETLNSWGYVPLKVDKDWLQGSASNNLVLSITSLEMGLQGTYQTIFRPGPIITITSRPYNPYTPPPPTRTPQKASLFVTLLAVATFIILGAYSLCVLNRNHRQIGLGNMMSRIRKYRSRSKNGRRQRMGLGRTGDIKLDDYELVSGPGISRDVPAYWKEEDPFSDNPGTRLGINIPQPRENYIRGASDELDSLVSTPIEERSDDESWPFESTPTRSKAVGNNGFVKEEVQHFERLASNAAHLGSN